MDKKIEAERQIKKLVGRFEENISQYKKADYDEANTRTDFIDPFFENLGWDVANKQGHAEQYRDVVREAKVIIAGKHQAPDYSFRIGRERKFFVEAKKPAVDLKHRVSSAYQLRRYAYTAKLSLSILTDFEEFSVYDTRIKPASKDSASCARIFYCTYKDYLKNFDFIYDTFSKEGILKGSFDRYAKSTRNKKGTSEVDKEFLKLIDKWRENLAKNIALRNKRLSLYELNFAVQKIIDRIIFLRIAEDRQIEDYGKLQTLLNGTNTYKRLLEICFHSDKKYNSGLFDFDKDEITPELTVDDKILKEILKSVYYPESPYEFSVLDVEILGNIYEQFLGKTIRLTPAHLVKVEEKPEVKKAGGVYYTPKYIVDYIVKNTVGEVIKGKTPKKIDKIKILDPACGSGSFLLGAYQCLLNYHLDWYSKDKNCKKALKKGRIIQTGKESFQLTIAEKQRILLNTIFGVDIDTQAVEVSKLSLLLKLLEGETEESTRQLFKYTQLKLLPDLSNNIKCGNSLIGPDFYDTQQTTLFGETEMRRINVFDWKSAFPDIFQNGGFDVVIGNPPYVRVDIIPEILKSYYKKRYLSAKGKYDIYYLFIEKSFKLLKNENGLFGMIVPNKFAVSDSASKLREIIIEKSREVLINSVSSLYIFGKKVRNYPVLLFFSSSDINNRLCQRLKFANTSQKEQLVKGILIILTLNKENLTKMPENIFPINTPKQNLLIYFRIQKNTIPLANLLKISEGFRIPSKFEKVKGDEHILKQYQFSRYKPVERGTYINKEDRIKAVSDNSERYINCLKDKIVIAEDALRLEATLDRSKSLCQGGVYFGVQQSQKTEQVSLIYLLGILNSKLVSFIYKSLFAGMHMGGGYLRFRSKFLNYLPIRTIDFSNPPEKAMHDKLVTLVGKMLELQKKYHSVKLESDKKMYQTRIDALDNQIDTLVYNLYGLTKEEREIIKKNLNE